MAKKKAIAEVAADSPEPVATVDVEPVAVETPPDVVRDVFGRVLVGPVLCQGLRYEHVAHKRAYHLSINGRDCHFVGEVGDAREYRPIGRS